MTPAVVVQIQDDNDVSVSSNNVPITLTLSAGTGAIGGTTTRNTDSTGKATFNNLTFTIAGAGKQLTAAASGIGSGLAGTNSTTFTITSGGGGGGTPAFSTSSILPAGYKTQGTNSGAGVFTQILGATRVDEPLTNWVLVNFQNADGSGGTAFTNPVSPAMPYAFYRLRTGDTSTKLQPPSIGIQPQSIIVSTGAPASFTVTATGPMLQYLWYFNGNPIANATNSAINIPSAQTANIGNYSVAVANPAGYVNSAVATLGLGNVGPIITQQPVNQTNSAGGTAIFTVAAIGTMPLTYQWYYNNSTPLIGQTGTQLLLAGVTTNDAGNYRCNVTNSFGNTNSANAYLAVNPVPTDLPVTNLMGWADFAGVTGGAGGTVTTVSTYATLRAACRAAGPIIIQVDGILIPNEDYCYIEGYDKTIIGLGTNSGLAYAGFRCAGTNIIIANMSFNSTNDNSDGVTIDNSSHGTGRNIWVDHCTFYDCTDGSVDVTKGADYVTVSWCKFHYAPVPAGVVNHEFVNLLGSSDSDNGANYHVTFHHNWYGAYCRERMPSVRFGHTHVFNNYYDCVGNNYCVRTRINAEVLVENNYFLGVQNPWERFVTSGSAGLLKATGNITNNCTFVNGWVSGAVVIPGTDTLGSDLNPPPYTYTLGTASDIPYYVQTYAGSGKYPYVP
jgi:pectate lyase